MDFQFANISTDYSPHGGQLSVCPDVPGDHMIIEGWLTVLIEQAWVIIPGPRVLSPGHTRIALSGDWMMILIMMTPLVPGVVGPGPVLVPTLSLRHKSVWF